MSITGFNRRRRSTVVTKEPEKVAETVKEPEKDVEDKKASRKHSEDKKA